MESRTLATDSSKLDARHNQTEVDPIKIESKLVGRFNTRQNREPTEEQSEPAEQGIESDSDEEVEEEPTVSNEGR
mgnify:CR=1 FL=1